MNPQLSPLFEAVVIGIRLAHQGSMQIATYHPEVEARTWLHNNPNPTAFATNRFGETVRALEFVESLYATGATEVLIEDPGVDADGAPYADTPLVRCPSDSDATWRLIEFCEREGPSEVPDEFRMNVYVGELRLWWD